MNQLLVDISCRPSPATVHSLEFPVGLRQSLSAATLATTVASAPNKDLPTSMQMPSQNQENVKNPFAGGGSRYLLVTLKLRSQCAPESLPHPREGKFLSGHWVKYEIILHFAYHTPFLSVFNFLQPWLLIFDSNTNLRINSLKQCPLLSLSFANSDALPSRLA